MVKVKPIKSKLPKRKLTKTTSTLSQTKGNVKLHKISEVRLGSSYPKVSGQKLAAQQMSQAGAQYNKLVLEKAHGTEVRGKDIRSAKRIYKKSMKTFKSIANEAAVTKRLGITTAGTTLTSIGTNIATAITGNASYGQSGRNDDIQPTNSGGSNNDNPIGNLVNQLPQTGNGSGDQYNT